MRSVLFSAALLAAPVALAQPSSLTLRFQANTSQNSLSVGRGDCPGRDISVTYELAASATVCEDLTLFVTTAASCASEPPTANSATDFVIDTIPRSSLGAGTTSRTGTLTFDVGELPIFFEGRNACETELEATHRICAVTQQPGGTLVNCDSPQALKASPLTVTYDSKPPAAPALVAPVASGDSVFRPRLASPAAEINDYRVTARPTAGAADGGTLVERASGWTAREGIAEIRNVENGVAYTLTAVARDAAGNESQPSVEVLSTPQPTKGFLDAYDAAGGEETGGCTASGGGLVAVALLAVAGALRARNGRQS